MKILSFIRSIPDLSNVRISRRQEKIFEKGERLLAPISEHVLEFVIQLKESNPPSEVVALLLGPPEEESVLRHALAFGADRAVHLIPGPNDSVDDYGKAALLAQAIRKEGNVDLIVMGEASGMGGGGQTGPRVAEILGCEHLSGVVGLETISNRYKVKFLGSGEGEVAIRENLQPPIVTVVSKKANQPRLLKALSIVKAAGKPKENRPVGDFGIASEELRRTEILRTQLVLESSSGG